MTKFLNISTDTALGGSSASDEVVSSQKALKTYIDNHSGGGSVAIDEKSITKNSSDEIQTVGVIDQNATTTAIKTWTGTKAQYDALVLAGTIDANTLYNITDDTDVGLDLLQTIYPVGSIYIGTMAVCPMSALFGTWTLVGTKMLTDVTGSNSVPVKGNNISIGLTDGSQNAALQYLAGSGLFASPTRYGSDVGTAAVNEGVAQKTIGLTTDATKSGIIADISSSLTKNELTVNIWQRSA